MGTLFCLVGFIVVCWNWLMNILGTCRSSRNDKTILNPLFSIMWLHKVSLNKGLIER